MLALLLLLPLRAAAAAASSDEGVTLPTRCETCKFVVRELEQRFGETGRTHDVVQTREGKSKKYRESELRFVETLEGLCERILAYKMHKEHEDSNRFAKEQSQTFQTLHGLVDKGVKVELGIPYELWDAPSVEVTRMKAECEQLLELYEDELEEWFLQRSDTPLDTFLCQERFLKGHDSSCFGDAAPDRSEL